MKRLLTYLGLLATLLAMPYSAKAETWAYYLYGDINAINGQWNSGNAKKDAYKFGETYSDNNNDQPTWTKTFTGAQLDPDGNGVAYFKILLDKDGTTTNLGPSGSNQVLEVNGSALTLNNGGDKAYEVTGLKPTAEYTIKYVSTTRYGGTISITGPDTENTNIKLKGSYSKDNWATSTDYTSFSDGIYTWEFDKSEFPSGTVFKLFEYVVGTKGHWYSNGAEVTEDWSNEFLSENNNMSVSYTDNDELIKISVQAKKSNGKWKIRIVKTYEPHDYYWVSPQVTNGQKLPYFKMVASRNRSGAYGDGKISTKYFTFTMKDDDFRYYNGNPISAGTTIQWYIVRDDNKVFYRPATALAYNDTPASYGDDHSGSGDLDSYVKYKNYWNGSSYAGADAYKTTDATRQGSFAFRKGDHKSVTFNMNADKGHIFFNYVNTGLANPSTTSEFYLIGNFKAASETESISISDTSHKLTRLYYTERVGSETYSASCDSVVYVCTVYKPTTGDRSWGNLYLDVNPSGNVNWGSVYRPLISLYNGLDGRALVGGLTTAGQGGNDNKGDQSLNPETSDKYTSYEFRFNATTMTYRITFHTSLYLVGPGVSSTEGTGSWDLRNVTSSDPRIRLKATQEVGHYRNYVYFTNGNQFRFIQNTDEASPTYQTTWMENTNEPKFSSATTDDQYTPGNETQYKNYLDFQNGTGENSNTTPSGTSVTFDLPTGWYYVNFYENSGGTPYYTIERQMDLRDFNEVHYNNGSTINEDRNILYRNGYNFFRVWSDHIAWAKPDDIDVFVVTAFSVDANGQATVTLTKQNGNYIPAKTGVILASTETKSSFGGGIVYKEALSGTAYNTAWMDMTPADAPATTYSGTSMLTPLYEATNLQRFINDGGTDYANYLFGFYRMNKVISNYGNNNDFGLGFWLTTGVGNTYANSAFLRILKSDAEKMGVGTTYTMTSGAGAPAFYLVFEDAPEPVVTGIKEVQNVRGVVANDCWYTLQGVRTAKPTQRGIYIYNGKKVILND
ncbi:MAG: hypothetical protein SPK85_06490 [Prevotella sp.]|nr:hypothetical protein [Prevotella sp.]